MWIIVIKENLTRSSTEANSQTHSPLIGGWSRPFTWPQMFTKTLPPSLPQRHMWSCIRLTMHRKKGNTHSEVNRYYTELMLIPKELKCHQSQIVKETCGGKVINGLLAQAFRIVDPLWLQTHFLFISLPNWRCLHIGSVIHGARVIM